LAQTLRVRLCSHYNALPLKYSVILSGGVQTNPVIFYMLTDRKILKNPALVTETVIGRIIAHAIIAGELNLLQKHFTRNLPICGWVHRRRDHGGLIFLDIPRS